MRSEEARVMAAPLGEEASGMEKKDDPDFQPEHLGEGTRTDVTRNAKGWPESSGIYRQQNAKQS